ncbi:MAG: hypothetical protein R3C60_01120 [Parvularculaceae bacterium]
MMRDSVLKRLEAFEFDDTNASFTFSMRLARENGWSVHFARRVVREYKRFAYLAVSGGIEATPSDEIDQAWHLHMTYTRNYWGPFAEALGAPLHHEPTRGGAADRDRFKAAYSNTLAAYARIFGETPPADIWPPSAIRFGEAPFMRRVNVKRNFVIPKRMASVSVAAGAVIAALAANAAAAQQISSEEISKFVNENPVVGIVVALVLLTLIFRLIFGRGGRGGGGCAAGCGGDSGCGSGCSGCGGD